jgi:hypothetical protein
MKLREARNTRDTDQHGGEKNEEEQEETEATERRKGVATDEHRLTQMKEEWVGTGGSRGKGEK